MFISFTRVFDKTIERGAFTSMSQFYKLIRLLSENFYKGRISVKKFLENYAKVGVKVQLGFLCTEPRKSGFALLSFVDN